MPSTRTTTLVSRKPASSRRCSAITLSVAGSSTPNGSRRSATPAPSAAETAKKTAATITSHRARRSTSPARRSIVRPPFLGQRVQGRVRRRGNRTLRARDTEAPFAIRSCFAVRSRSACRSCATALLSCGLTIAAQAGARLPAAVAGQRESPAALARVFEGCGYHYLGLGTEIGEHREDAAVVLSALGDAELHEDASDVLFDRALGDHEALGDRPVRPPLGH